MINNLGKFAHPPKSGGRNPGVGRHNAGANPAPGSGINPPNKGSQSEPAGNKPITGGRTQMNPGNTGTSMSSITQAQQQVNKAPAPFGNAAGPANVSAPAVMPYGSTFKHTAGLSGSPAPKNPPAGPVGGMKPKTLGKTVGVNFPGPKRKGAMTASAKKGGHSLLYGD